MDELINSLIYDRTKENLDIIKSLSKKRYQDFTDKEKQLWIDNVKKACYTYIDLNRVENLIEYLGKRIKSLGFNINLKEKKTWVKDDIPTIIDMERYLYNIGEIRRYNIVLNNTPNAPTDINLDYLKANDIEKIIHDVNLTVVDVKDTIIYCGDLYGGEF